MVCDITKLHSPGNIALYVFMIGPYIIADMRCDMIDYLRLDRFLITSRCSDRSVM